MPTPTDPSPLPQILCLHSAGSSAPIFAAQSRTLTSLLRPHISFSFISAPFPSPLGPSLSPYASSGPFYRWQCDMASSSAFSITPEEVRAEQDRCRDMLVGKMENMPNLVGIMGFSQGARVVAGLLLYLARVEHPVLEKIKFAIMCCATYPVLWCDGGTEGWVGNGGLGEQGRRKIQIPSLHLVGREDAWKGEAERMAREVWSEEVGREVWEFVGGHQVPLGKGDGKRVGEWVKQFLTSVE